MFKRFKDAALTSRIWLSAGVFCLGVSIVLGYHDDQVAAHSVLAEKVGTPPTVLLQDFNQSRHSNILNEVQVLVEAALPEIIATNIGTEANPNWVQLLPLYPVGAVARPFANKYFADKAGPRRPMPRANRAELSAGARRMEPLEDTPMGIILIEPGLSINEVVLTRGIGVGAHGPLIALTGTLLSSSSLQESASAALADAGTWVFADVPLIVPYTSGARVAAVGKTYENLRSGLEWLAVLLVLVGICNAFNLFLRFRSPKLPVTPAFEHVDAVGAFPGVFQAIQTQEEIVREEQEEAERSAAASRRAFSRIQYHS